MIQTNQSNEKTHQQEYKDIVTSLLEKAKKKGLHAEAALSVESGLSVSVRLREVETLEFHQGKSLGLTVFNNKKKGSVSVSDLSPKALDEAFNAACRIAELIEEDPAAGLADKNDLAKDIPDLDLYHPWDLAPDQAIQFAKTCEEAALSFDTRITNSEGASCNTHQKYRVYGNTLDFLSGYSTTYHSVYCSVIAQEKNMMQRDMDYTVSREAKTLTPFTKVGHEAAKRALRRLNARKLKTTEAPVIFSADIAGSLFGSFLGAISGGNLYRKSSFLLDHLDKQVFPDFLQIEEVPHLLRGLGSAPFDHEGVTTKQHPIIRNGILKSYVLSSYSARKLGLKTTGNAGGVHNLMVSHGLLDQEELIKKMHRGLLVTELMGHGVNILTGDYSRGVFGFWVENGEIQYPVEEITIAGNLRDMFMNLVDIGNDLEKRGNIQVGSVLLEKMTIAGH